MVTRPLDGILQDLSLNEFIMLLERLLPYEGFGDVEVLGRRKTKQKSRFGGFDLRCRTKIGNQTGTVLVKVMPRFPLNTRMIHELAGCVLHHDAFLGILVSPFNRTALRAVSQALDPKLRVRILDAAELTRLLKCSGIGVRDKGEVDYAFFTRLREASQVVLQTLESWREGSR